MTKTSIAAALSAVVLCGLTAAAQNAPPKGWMIQGSRPDAFVIKLDTGTKSAHGNVISIQSKGEPDGMATLMQAIKAGEYKGKRVRFSGYLKGEGVSSWAGLWMRVNSSDNRVSAFDNMEKRALRGTEDWRKYEVVLDIPSDSATISFGALLTGSGHIWVSGLTFQAVAETVPATAKSLDELNRKPANLEFN